MAEERAQRRLAAILAADVVGYSRLMERDEAGTLAALKARRSEVLQPVVSKHRGRIVKLMGDGVLIEFASAVDAVECAAELQDAMAAANARLPDDQRIVLRVGINLGDVIVEGGDIYGDGVNIAARLETMAEPGSVFLSGKVRQEVGSKLGLTFEDLGERNLKNIAGPVQVYRLSGSTSAVLAAAPGKAAGSPKPSIAVLPFTNMSGDPEQEYFSDGITEDIITELSRFRSLSVIARNSSFTYRGKNTITAEIGRQLGVRYVVEGSVRKAGKQVRITAQLIEAATGNHIWAERFDRELVDIFAVQDEVTRSVVSRLAVRLEDEELQTARRKPPQDMRAYDLCLRGWRCLDQMTAEATNQAISIFKSTINIDPSYARAYAGLAWAYDALASYSAYSESELEREELWQAQFQNALSAVTLDETDSRAHIILASTYHRRREFTLARRHLDRAFALNPNDADALILGALLLTLEGEPETGVAFAEQAIRLNPYHPGYYFSVLGAGHFFNRKYLEAAQAREKAPHGFPEHHASLAAAYALAGDEERAGSALKEFLERAPSFWKERPTARLVAGMFVFKCQEYEALYLEGLRKAGLPE